jgi:hypothetical protein
VVLVIASAAALADGEGDWVGEADGDGDEFDCGCCTSAQPEAIKASAASRAAPLNLPLAAW